MRYLLVTFYITMAAAGYFVEFLFAALGMIPQNRHVAAITEGMGTAFHSGGQFGLFSFWLDKPFRLSL
jgi:hypothetical protein